MSTTVTTPNELEIRVERIFDAPRAHVYSVWTDPKLIPEWWGDGTTVEEMDVRPGGTYRFRTAHGVVEGEFREVEPPGRLVQTFQNHLQTLEFEDLGEQTKLTQTMRFETTEQRDTTMQYGVEEGAKGGFARVDALLEKIAAGGRRRGRTEVDRGVASAGRDGDAHLVPLIPVDKNQRKQEHGRGWGERVRSSVSPAWSPSSPCSRVCRQRPVGPRIPTAARRATA